MLVNGQGNFGSIDGDSAAAMRYTEARFNALAEEVLLDLDKDTVDFTSNFDDTLKEPTVLPAKAPLLLLNGASGIAVGMATNMAPHNLNEICDAITQRIENELETSVVVIEPHSGKILSIIGGKSYKNSTFNRAIYAKRQPASNDSF